MRGARFVMSSYRLKSPSSERNKVPILQQLTTNIIPQIINTAPAQQQLNFLEVASGTGEHVSFFAENFPNIHFFPTDVSDESFLSIQGWCEELSNVAAPQVLDCSWLEHWKTYENTVDIVYAANMCHISTYDATKGLISGGSRALKSNGKLCIYGPFKVGGEFTSESNLAFDISLKQRCADWGYRDVEDLVGLAHEVDLVLEQKIDMPANNFLLVFGRMK